MQSIFLNLRGLFSPYRGFLSNKEAPLKRRGKILSIEEVPPKHAILSFEEDMFFTFIGYILGVLKSIIHY